MAAPGREPNGLSLYKTRGGSDRLVDRVFVTIPPAERMQVLGDMVHHMTDQVTMLGPYYRVLPTMISNRLLHVSPRADDTSHVSGNAVCTRIGRIA
jgi:hypothetical protein